MRDEADSIGNDRALWHADCKIQRQLIVLPTDKGVVPAGVGSEAERATMRQYKSTLYYARNMRWTSQALLAATTKRPAMGGSSWTTLSHADERVRKAFALWANSTLGMMVHWTQGQRTQTGRSRTQVNAIKKTPCPRLDKLETEELNEAATAFDAVASQVLLPACQAHADEVRIAIDEAIVRLFGWEESALHIIADLRALWCREPSVHGNNKKALLLLEG